MSNVIRFMTCGSVDDGKSTLIGRLLYDTKAVLSDQIQALSKTKHARAKATADAIDLALLTDGLEAEREQGITIDVAYRYFATEQRKFIVADTPGHEQYTRNMVTGASQSDVAVLIIDPTKVLLTQGQAIFTPQTFRHAQIVQLMGIRHIAVVVNKMDEIQFDEGVFNKIAQHAKELIKAQTLAVIPVCALHGDNVVHASENTPWYQGPTLLSWLESLEIQPKKGIDALRLPIQYVHHQDGHRNYLGRIESGTISEGQRVIILPSHTTATVSHIQRSNSGTEVAIRLKEDIDISRGDMIVDSQLYAISKRVVATLCWLDPEPLTSRKYLLRHTTQTVGARVVFQKMGK